MKRCISCAVIAGFILWGSVLLGQDAPIAPGDPLDLDKAIEIGLKMNPSVMGYQYAMKAREAQVGQARAGYFPKLDGSAGFTRNFEAKNTHDPYYTALLDQYNQNVASVTLQQMLFDFWRTPTSVNVSKYNLESSRSLSMEKDVVVVPERAIQLSQTGKYAFVVKAGTTVEYRVVTTDRTVDGLTVVKKGIGAGETVVTDGHFKLRDGFPVEIRDSLASGRGNGGAATKTDPGTEAPAGTQK